MKVLRIYDHLGELKKELNIFVEGEDFKYQTVTPECIWLGTIVLEEAGKEPEPAPKWMPVEEPITEEEAKEMQEDIAIDAIREQEMAQEAIKEAEVEPEIPLVNGTIGDTATNIEEVESEPEKVHRKRSRKSGTHPSDYLKSIKVVREDDTGGDTSARD